MFGIHIPAKDLAAVAWTKSNRSGSQAYCVEAGSFADGVVIRNSNAPDAGGLLFTTAEFTAFVGGVRDGDFDHLSE